MTDRATPSEAPWLRVLQFPLVRLLLLGPVLFLLIGISNGLWAVTFADRPVMAVGMALLMALLGLAVYAAFVRFVEQRAGQRTGLAEDGP